MRGRDGVPGPEAGQLPVRSPGEVEEADEPAGLKGQEGGAAVGVQQVLLQGLQAFHVQGQPGILPVQQQGRPAFLVGFLGHAHRNEGKPGEEAAALDGIIQQPFEKPPGPDDGHLLPPPGSSQRRRFCSALSMEPM